MMRFFKSLNLILAVGLAGLVGCATFDDDRYSRSPTEPPTDPGERRPVNIKDVVFKFDKNGNLVPFTSDGRAFVPCDKNTEEKCGVFRDEISVKKIESLNILMIEHTASPPCTYAESGSLGGGRITYIDPACLEYLKSQ
jgi:hypothetical protein